MASMFTNYDNNINSLACGTHFHPSPKKYPKIITNIKGEVLGVQVERSELLQLYFHLEDTYEVDFDEIYNSSALFEVLTTTHKVVISKEFLTAEILNQDTTDLVIYLSKSEMETLKKETYNMRLTLKTTETSYEVFAEKDGYLVVR